MSERSGQVQTVQGLVDPADLGHTQTHEHLLVCLVPQAFLDQAPPDEPIRLETVGKLRMMKTNPEEAPGLIANAFRLESDSDAIAEMRHYRAAGGGTIVEATSIGIKRNPEGLARISAATGVHVVMGSGYYVQSFHPTETADWVEAQFAEQIVRDVVEGADDTGIRSGMIGEIGLDWPVHPQEAKVIAAAAQAQQQTGAPVMIHPGRDPRAPIEAIRAIERAGGNPARTIIAHIDRTLFNLEDMCELAKTGCFLEFDLFGWETSFYPGAPIDMPNDAIRIDYLIALFEAGYGDQLVISQDMFAKYHLTRYGGHGYSHILENILPMMDRKGFDRDQVRTVCIDNPSRILTFE